MKDPFDPYPKLGKVKQDLSEYDYGSMEEGDSDSKDVLAESEEPRPLASLWALTIFAALILCGRLFDLQIIQGTKNKVLAQGNSIRSREIAAPRGEITDRNGTILASNTPMYSLEVYPAELPKKKADRETVYTAIQEVTKLDMAPTRDRINKQGLAGFNPITIANQVDRETALVWQAKLASIPGVSITKTPQRTYTDLGGIGQVLGYVGRVSASDLTNWANLSPDSLVGKSGLELSYEDSLRGQSGQQRVEVDAQGRIDRVLSQVSPKQGNTLKLTIDANLEKSLADHLAEVGQKRDASQAAGVIIDVHTGGILAMVSLPSYNPNVFVQEKSKAERAALLTNPDNPMINRAVNGTYPSGSTIKPVFGAAALAEGTISPDTKLDTSIGAIEIGQFRFPDWKVHGLSDVRQAIAESNDIFFYAVAGGYDRIGGLGVDRMKKWLNKFGFGKPTGIDLASEASGLVPDEAWKKSHIKESWYIGDTYHFGIGQGYFLTTPLQLVDATAAIANGGTLLTPHLVDEIHSSTGGLVQKINPKPAGENIIDDKYLQTIREGMRLTVTGGTSRSLNELSVETAGKTGTAQFGQDNKETHSWFTGFAPYNNPQIAWAVIVEGGGESTDSAVPAVKAVLQDWINSGNLK